MNRNGVVSTKWVRPAALNASSSTIPEPASVRKLKEDWSKLDGSPIDGVFKESSLYGRSKIPLSIFDYDAVCIVNDLMSEGVYLGQQPLRVFNQTCYQMEDGEEPFGDPVLGMNDIAVFGEIVMGEESNTDDMEPVVKGLGEHFGIGRDYLKGVTDDERRAAVALVTVLTRLEHDKFIRVDDPYNEGPGGDYRTFQLRSSELAELVKARPEDATQIAQIINDRGTDDVGVVTSVLDSEFKALRDGAL